MILKTENGCFAYRGGPRILDNINIEVSSGEILAILGPNGAGKTTLLRCMTDMLRWQSGRSTLDGEDIHGMPARKLWSRMAYVPQARSAAASYTAFQTVLLGRSAHIGAFSAPSEEDMRVARRVMESLGIEELADKPCSAMSGGEFQMVLIARAMAAEPEVLVLDEPESNLDFRNQLIVLDALSSLAAGGMACIFNTHYPAHALQRADKSLILSKSGKCVFGTTSRTVTEDNIREAFGVNAVIGEVETPENVLKSVMPLSIAGSGNDIGRETQTRTDASGGTMSAAFDGTDNGAQAENDAGGERLASISIISGTNEIAGRINSVLGAYSHLIVGRMGQPYRKYGLYIISLTLDGPAAEIEELSHRLGILPGVSVKTTYAFSEGK